MGGRRRISLGDVDDLVGNLGARIRMLRAQRHYTLEALAAVTEISPAHLSRLESGTRQPSLAVALSLAAGLGVSLSELLGPTQQAPDEGIVVRGATAPIRTVGGVTFQALTPPQGQQQIQAVRVSVPVRPRASKPQTHEGEQWLYVTRGPMRMVLGQDTFVLETGDAANFDGSVPHVLSGEGHEAEILIVRCSHPGPPHGHGD